MQGDIMAPGPARRLTHEEILHAAFLELEGKGPSVLSLRGVAAAVGVAPTALYTYFPSKSALMGAMVERLLADVDETPTPTDCAPPSARLRSLAVSVHRAVTARPGAAALLISGPLDGHAAQSMNERLVGDFMAAGLDQDDSARASYALQVYVLGSALLAAADDVSDANGAPASRAASEFPLTDATTGIAAQHDSHEQFEWGLTRVLNGLLGTSGATNESALRG